MKDKEWTLDDTIKEMKEVREHNERVERVAERVEKCNQLKNRVDMLSEAGAKLTLKYLINESNNSGTPIVLQYVLVDAIKLGEEV